MSFRPHRALVASTIAALGLAVLVPATATYAAGSGAVRAAKVRPQVVADPATYVPLAPARLLDTRIGLGAAKRAVRPGETVRLQVSGSGPVPASGAGAVVLNLTVTGPTAGGYLDAFPAGVTRPTASTVNFVRGQTVPNLVVVKLGTGGGVNVYNGSSGTVQMVADVSGFYRSGGATVPGAYAAVTPARVVDTRTGLGAGRRAVAPDGSLTFTVAGHGGVPSSGVSAVMLNLTATQPVEGGYLTSYPAGGTRPTASSLNFARAETVPNLVATGLGTGGRVTVFNGSSGATQVFADVLGYYLDGTASSPGAFVPLPPSRVLDTRHGVGAPKAPIGTQGVLLGLNNVGGLPDGSQAAAESAVALNVTATDATASGYVRVTADSDSSSSNLNFVKGQTVANLVLTPVTRDGTVVLTVGSTGKVDLIADVTGYFLPVQPLTWSDPPTAFDPAVGTPKDVSCSSSAFCMLVDDNGGFSTYGNGSWSQPRHVTDHSFTVLSCVSSTFCMAGDYDGEVESYDGASWGAATVLNSSPNALLALTCVSRSFCIAIDVDGSDYTYDGGSWSAATASGLGQGFSISCVSTTYCVGTDSAGGAAVFTGTGFGPRVAVINDQFNGPTTVSCATSTDCVAVDGDGDTATFDGATWTDVPSGGQDVWDLACPTTAGCIGLGGEFSGGSVEAATFDGTSWTPFDLIASRSGVMHGRLSCSSASFCVGVDDAGQVLQYDGSVWGAPVLVDPSNKPEAISCPTTSFCSAVDGAGETAFYDGAHWSTPLAVDAGAVLTAVSCPSAAGCFAVDDAGQVVGYDGSGGSVVVAPVAPGHAMVGISCPTTTTCVALDDSWATYTWSGSTWTRHAPPAAAIVPSSIACASTVLCAAEGETNSGFEVLATFNGSTWSLHDTGAFGSVTSATSCVAPTLCRTVDDSGGSWLTQDGVGWRYAGTLGTSGGNGQAVYLSCAASYSCVATGEFSWLPVLFDGAIWIQDTNHGGYFPGPVSCPSVSTCVSYWYDGSRVGS